MGNAALDPGDYGDFTFVRGSLKSTAAALAVDGSDPNTAAPDVTRIVKTTPKSDFKRVFASVYADAACTLELWVWSKQAGGTSDAHPPKGWFRVFQQAVAAGFAETPANDGSDVPIPIPAGMPFFLRVEANGGSAKFVALAFH